MSVVTLRGRGDRLAIGDARRVRLHLQLVLAGQPIQQAAHLQLAETMHHRFVGRRYPLDREAGILRGEFLQNLPQSLFVAAFDRFDGQSVDRLGELQWSQVDVILVVRVVQYAVVDDVLDFGHCTDVAGQTPVYGHILLPAQHE